jgi:hypothetical protein
LLKKEEKIASGGLSVFVWDIAAGAKIKRKRIVK